jgi:hypothetical protein
VGWGGVGWGGMGCGWVWVRWVGWEFMQEMQSFGQHAAAACVALASHSTPVVRTALFLSQENAGNMSHRLPFLRMVATQLQVPIFALDYRGYGMSSGTPNQPGIMQDAQVGGEVEVGEEGRVGCGVGGC